MLSSFVAMFIVTPVLSTNPSIYGIFTFCGSLNMLLMYSDFGFLTSGQKYAAEYYSKGDIQKEYEVIGFSSFVLMIVIAIVSIVFFVFSYYPSMIITDFENEVNRNVASKLLFLLGCSSFLVVFHRTIQMILSIRLEDYIFQKLFFVGNLLRILSVSLFFNNGSYNIVEYFLFGQFILLIVYSIVIYRIREKLNYDFSALLSFFRFNREQYFKSKKLAFSSFTITILWIAFYELDFAFIGKYIGILAVAQFSVVFTLMGLFRNIFGYLYSPVGIRFNHINSLNENSSVMVYFAEIVILFAPFVLLPVTTFYVYREEFILSWVGLSYNDSVRISGFLLLSNIFSFISYPSGMLITTKENLSYMLTMFFSSTIFYWSLVLLMVSDYGLAAVAISKFLGFLLFAIFYSFYVWKYFRVDILGLFWKVIKQNFLPVVFVLLSPILWSTSFDLSKSSSNLAFVAMVQALILFIAFLILFITSDKHRNLLLGFLKVKFI